MALRGLHCGVVRCGKISTGLVFLGMARFFMVCTVLRKDRVRHDKKIQKR